MTAADLLKSLGPLRPAADGCELVLPALPAELVGPTRALQTGLRALLTGRPWHAYGVDGRGVGPLRDGALDPAAPVPWAAVKLCVAGDPRWDAVRAGWRLDLPHLFGPPPVRPHRQLPTSARRCPFLPLRAGTRIDAGTTGRDN